ncbi:T9SS type A sorting domain-containing protein [Paracrocinitomix mangrovi]|uniref:T9SS type A sorting domain-containing protein n=1 Tax=Paracrocinitomix mangrovi TaxID=2862509 RepID=UPI001C8DB9B8|nr:T9SS type A sorting domain-containing protein [Paracrocinitomix mangrovi]UKN01350.1 T9SS type A sorting domain-containing protein [Paracrocinitomix mangrovi]
MKKNLLLCLILSAFTSFGQLQAVGEETSIKHGPFGNSSGQRSTDCGNDTILYNLAKATATQGIQINNSTSAFGFCQYFDCPQPIQVHGAQFVAYKSDNVSGNSIDVTVTVYEANADSLPFGAPVASTTVAVDTIIYAYNIDSLIKTAMFDSAVTLDQPYIIAVFNNSPNSIVMYSSSYNNGDGQGENLGSAKIGFNWVRGYNVNVGGTPFDADMLFYPIVSYDVDAEFSVSPNCELLAGDKTVTNLSSPILFNRFYNVDVFQGNGDTTQCYWDWGDGSPIDTAFEATHYFAAGVYNIILSDSLTGWTTSCADVDTLSTCYQPAGINDTEQTDFIVYPIPANDWLKVEAKIDINELKLVDMSGKVVKDIFVDPSHKTMIDIGDLSNGVYVINVKLINEMTLQKRIIISR